MWKSYTLSHEMIPQKYIVHWLKQVLESVRYDLIVWSEGSIYPSTSGDT